VDESRSLFYWQVALASVGAIIVNLGLAADALGIGGAPGIGLSQIVMGSIGGAILISAVLLRSAAVRRLARLFFFSRFALVFGGVAGALVIGEIAARITESSGRQDTVVLNRPVPDPQLGLRLPAHAPGHDANGFRNPSVPARADIVTIGDSQTWGINAAVNETWPRVLADRTGRSVYSMALGFYGPAQYLTLARSARSLSPRLVVVGVYLGNDLWGAYQATYALGAYAAFRVQDTSRLLPDTIERRAVALSSEEQRFHSASSWLEDVSALVRLLERNGILSDPKWHAGRAWSEAHPDHGATFQREGFRTVLTPAYRLLAVDLEEPRIAEGLRLTLGYLAAIGDAGSGARALVILIPTKESVCEPGVNESHRRLLEKEDLVRAELIRGLSEKKIEWVDALPALRKALARGERIYPASTDGHPTAAGYAVIAAVVQEAMKSRGW
jgi:lysophospholipase L1-like esterase